MTTTRSRKPVVLFVDDTKMLTDEFPLLLRREGHSVLAAGTAGEGLRRIEEAEQIDLAILDIELPLEGCDAIGAAEAAGGKLAGLVLAVELRRKFKRVPIIFWSTASSRDIRRQVLKIENARLLPKAAPPTMVIELANETLEGMQTGKRPSTFIVHGHDQQTMLQLKDFLQNRLRFPPPVVLREMESIGHTVIEKLENFSLNIDIVFVLLTPDDRVVASDGAGPETARARQNVVFELGYFMGVLGRTSGRLIILHKAPVEIPSDIAGVILIDISRGFDEAGREIMQELREWI